MSDVITGALINAALILFSGMVIFWVVQAGMREYFSQKLKLISTVFTAANAALKLAEKQKKEGSANDEV